MKTLLLTIVGPVRTADLAVPGNLPVDKLIPELLQEGLVASDDAAAGSWALAIQGGQPLPLHRSLAESGVGDGQVLQLRPQSGDQEGGEARGPRVDSPAGVASPAASGRAVLPPHPTKRERLVRSARYIEALERQISGPQLQRCATIAIVSPKGGVGKTTVSVLLASLLARIRADRVVLVDADSDYGSVGPWLAPGHEVSVNELAAELEQPGYLRGDIADHMAHGADGLLVCPAPRDPASMAALDRERYGRLIASLQDAAGILILDCGTGLGQPGVQAAILASDQLVLVSDTEPTTLAQVAASADLLHHTGLPATVLVNQARPIGGPAPLGARFTFANAVLSISNEVGAARAVCSAEFSWQDAPRSWNRELRELAAVLALAWR